MADSQPTAVAEAPVTPPALTEEAFTQALNAYSNAGAEYVATGLDFTSSRAARDYTQEALVQARDALYALVGLTPPPFGE